MGADKMVLIVHLLYMPKYFRHNVDGFFFFGKACGGDDLFEFACVSLKAYSNFFFLVNRVKVAFFI